MSSSPTAGAVTPARRSHCVVLALAVVTAGLIVVWMMWPRPHEHVVLHAGTARYVVTATVGSSRVGTTAIDLDLTSRQSGPVDRATVTIAAIMPLMGQAAQPVPATFSGHGHYRAADLSRRVPEPGTADEIGRLAETTNRMLARLEDSALRQRHFVANASHEPRSPLTMLRTNPERRHKSRTPWAGHASGHRTARPPGRWPGSAATVIGRRAVSDGDAPLARRPCA